MKKTELDKFRKVLEASVTELRVSARWRESIAIETSADELDRVLQAQERESAVQSLETVTAKLRAARAALQRMEHGSYGICLKCEEEISPKRLAALPSAALCIRCQEESDCRCGANTARPMLAIAA